MKILIIIDSLGSGGAERSTAVLVDYLYENNFEFKIVCLDRKEIGVQKLLQEKDYSIEFLKSNGFYGQVKEIASIIKNHKFSIVHSILFRSNLRTRLARLFVNFYHIESLVNTTYSKERFRDKKVNSFWLRVYKKIDEITAKRYVNHFHSITQTVKDHYVQEIDLDPEKITVIPRGRKPILNNYEEKPQNIGTLMQLVNVGRHEFQKGQIHLVRAAKILKEEGYNFHLTILGRNGTSTPEIEKFIVQNNLLDLISLKGFKDNVSEYLLRSDLFVFPSLYEGLGGALIEAQAAGLPIACNDIPVLHEVVQENINGKFFDVHDIASLVSSIRFFLDKPKKLEEYGRESLLNYEAKFDEKMNNEKLVNLYKTYVNLP